MKHTTMVFMTFALLFGAFTVEAQQTKEVNVQAGSADDFVSRIGVNTHPMTKTFSGLYDNPYADTAQLRNALVELGIRNIRADGHPQAQNWNYWRSLYLMHGIKLTPTLYPGAWTLQEMIVKIKSYKAMIAAIDGPNETDCSNIRYNDKGFPEGIIEFQNDLYQAIKNDATIAHIPIISPSTCRPANYVQLNGCMMDKQNLHHYTGNQPMDGISGNIAESNKVISPNKPIWATESGYSTAINTDKWGFTEEAQCKYIPRLVAECWNRPDVERVYVYELTDKGTVNTEVEQMFGLIRNDWTRKPAFLALKNMIAVLQDPGAGFTPLSLKLTLSAANLANLHHIVLQKSNGDFYLLLWQEISSFNQNTNQNITTTDLPITITFGDNQFTNAEVMKVGLRGTLSTSNLNVTDNRITVSIPDAVTYIRLSAGSSDIQPVISTGLSIRQEGCNILISGLQHDDRLDVFDTSGALIRSDAVKKGDSRLSLPVKKGVYMLRIGNTTKKIII